MHVRSLPDTIPDYNFSLDVVEVLHDGSRVMRKEASNVIDSCLYAMYEGALKSSQPKNEKMNV
jgi:hypothetical protein